jgi:hypothetical protein
MSVDDTRRTGIDRRSALKKAAVAGTVAWTAPTILSSKTHAVEFIDGCTAKCQPNNQATVSFTVEVEPCIAGTPPGQQVVRGVVTQEGSAGQPCPCSQGNIQIVNPTPGQIVPLAPNPGNWDGVLSVGVNIICFDRAGNEIIVNCNFTVQLGAGSGNCESRGGDVYTVNNQPVGDCGAPTCVTA